MVVIYASVHAFPSNPYSGTLKTHAVASRLYVFIVSSSYILKFRSGIRPPAKTLTARALVPRVQYPYDPHAVISRLGVVDLNGDDVSGGGGSLLRFRGRERSPPPVSLLLLLLLLLLQLRQAGGIFRAGARGGALRAPQGRPRQGRTGQGRRVVLHLGLALRRRHRREVPRPRAGGLERALRRASRLALAEFGTFPGEKEVRVPPRRFGRLHFKRVVVVKLERRPGILAGKLNESPRPQSTNSPLWKRSPFPSSKVCE